MQPKYEPLSSQTDRRPAIPISASSSSSVYAASRFGRLAGLAVAFDVGVVVVVIVVVVEPDSSARKSTNQLVVLLASERPLVLCCFKLLPVARSAPISRVLLPASQLSKTAMQQDSKTAKAFYFAPCQASAGILIRAPPGRPADCFL